MKNFTLNQKKIKKKPMRTHVVHAMCLYKIPRFNKKIT